MNAKQKAERTGIIFLVLLIVSGAALLYRGNDAVALGVAKKEGILTAEQVKMSFDSVSGRLLHQAVQEGDTVKKGDVIMELDATDTDLAIKKTKAQIAQIEAQIAGKNGSRKRQRRLCGRGRARGNDFQNKVRIQRANGFAGGIQKSFGQRNLSASRYFREIEPCFRHRVYGRVFRRA